MVVMTSIAGNILTSTPLTVQMTVHMIMPMTTTTARFTATMASTTPPRNASTIKPLL